MLNHYSMNVGLDQLQHSHESSEKPGGFQWKITHIYAIITVALEQKRSFWMENEITKFCRGAKNGQILETQEEERFYLSKAKSVEMKSINDDLAEIIRYRGADLSIRKRSWTTSSEGRIETDHPCGSRYNLQNACRSWSWNIITIATEIRAPEEELNAPHVMPQIADLSTLSSCWDRPCKMQDEPDTGIYIVAQIRKETDGTKILNLPKTNIIDPYNLSVNNHI